MKPGVMPETLNCYEEEAVAMCSLVGGTQLRCGRKVIVHQFHMRVHGAYAERDVCAVAMETKDECDAMTMTRIDGRATSVRTHADPLVSSGHSADHRT
jgi:hypothetical protein